MPLPPQQPVYLIDGSRTPFSRQLRRNTLGETVYSPQDIAHIANRALLSRHSVKVSQIDDVIMASSHATDCANLATTAAQRLGCHPSLSSQTFLGNEQAGLQALSYAYQSIANQGKSVVLVGGVESLHSPIISLSDEMSEWLQAWRSASSLVEKTKVFNTLHTRYFRQRSSCTRSAEEQFLQYQRQAEAVVVQHRISLEAQAEYVNLSQRRLKYAQRNNTLRNIAPVYYPDGSSCCADENLISLDPESLKQAVQTNPAAAGLITHSSVAQTTEGACSLLLASQEFIDEHQITPLAKLSSPTWSPTQNAVKDSLKQSELSVSDIAYWEWDESSAAEVLALKQQAIYQSLNSFDCINLDGGSLALGAPHAASQLRQVLQLSHTLKRQNERYGVCRFGFLEQQDGAVLLANISGGTS